MQLSDLKLVIITTSRNARANAEALCASIDRQTNGNWQHIVIDDASDPDRRIDLVPIDPRRTVEFNTDRQYALRNIVNVARRYQDDPNVIIATVDGDDELCNDEAVNIVLQTYINNPTCDFAWTAHSWDVKPDMNVSQAMPNDVNPYDWGWCSSHMRTWRATLLKSVPDSNFLDWNGQWFKRGYDQILSLPLLYKARLYGYINDVCYLYKLDSVSIPLIDRPGSEVEQVHSIAYVRNRGFKSQ